VFIILDNTTIMLGLNLFAQFIATITQCPGTACHMQFTILYVYTSGETLLVFIQFICIENPAKHSILWTAGDLHPTENHDQ